MKRIVKWLIPCLVACFMGLGLVQNQGFIFAEDQMEDLQTTTFDSPETYSITGPETVKVGESITLTGSGRRYGSDHYWTFNSENGASVNIQYKDNNATITGVTAGTGTITHTYYYLWNQKTETIPITVVANDTSESQSLYIYTLIPGADPSLNLKDPNSRWNGMGVGSVTGLNNVTSYNVNTIIYGNNDIYQNIANGNIILPEEMPAITYPDGGRTYKYWGDDPSEVGTMPQIGDDLGNGETCSTYYYTIEWFRLTCGDGANAGHNNKITAVSTGTNTFHLDGTLKRNDILHVDFKLMNYDSDEFEPVNPEIYSWDIESGKTFNYSAVPTRTGYVATELDVDKNGTIDYVFDGWYTDEEMSGTKNTFEEEGKYTVTSNVTFYGRYVPASVAEPDKNYITVTKTFEGITKDLIPNNFSIQVGSKTLNKSNATTISDDGLIWTWKLNVDGGTYDISELNAGVENYYHTVTVNGVAKNDDDFGPVTVEESNIILTEGDYYESCNSTQFDIGVNNNTNTVFFGATKKQVVVISTNSFSEGQKAAIIKWLNNQDLSGNWSLNNVVFYSQAGKGNSFKLLAGTVSFDGNTVTFGNKKMWTHAMTATYDVTKALNPDVDILNKYEIKTVDITIQKEVTGLGADKTKGFNFVYSYDNESDNFTLTNGQEKTIENVPVGTTLTIQETDAQGYETTAQYGNAENLSKADVTDKEGSKNILITVKEGNDLVVVTNHRDAAPITGIIDNTPKGLGLIGSIVVEIAAIAFVLKKKRQLKM